MTDLAFVSRRSLLRGASMIAAASTAPRLVRSAAAATRAMTSGGSAALGLRHLTPFWPGETRDRVVARAVNLEKGVEPSWTNLDFADAGFLCPPAVHAQFINTLFTEVPDLRRLDAELHPFDGGYRVELPGDVPIPVPYGGYFVEYTAAGTARNGSSIRIYVWRITYLRDGMPIRTNLYYAGGNEASKQLLERAARTRRQYLENIGINLRRTPETTKGGDENAPAPPMVGGSYMRKTYPGETGIPYNFDKASQDRGDGVLWINVDEVDREKEAPYFVHQRFVKLWSELIPEFRRHDVRMHPFGPGWTLTAPGAKPIAAPGHGYIDQQEFAVRTIEGKPVTFYVGQVVYLPDSGEGFKGRRTHHYDAGGDPYSQEVVARVTEPRREYWRTLK